MVYCLLRSEEVIPGRGDVTTNDGRGHNAFSKVLLIQQFRNRMA